MIAVLLTSNRYKVMDTIRSRCQFYSLLGSEYEIDSEDVDAVESIIEVIEKYALKSISYLPINIDKDFKDKEFWYKVFKDMILYYEKALRVKEKLEENSIELINTIVEKNNSEKIIHKINILFETINNLEYNLNMSMMLDKFIIDFVGGD